MGGEIRLSVRELAGFLLHSGSIDNRFGGSDRAAEGARIHRRLQKAEGKDYHPEVPLVITVERGGLVYRVEGRADGVIERPEGVTIDEIKTTAYPAELITEDFDAAHWGQVECYAHIWCEKHAAERVTAQLTYYQVDTGTIRRFSREYTREELKRFFAELLDRYEAWARLQQEWTETRNGSIQALGFPFDAYRRGQHELAAAVYRTIAARGRLFCQAPTGIGKTMSTLFPAVKSMGEGLTERIFYLTAKTVTRRAAEEAVARMRGRGLRLRTVTLTAKDKVCFLERRECNPEVCPYANGYYDRINDVLFRLLEEREDLTRETMEAAARDSRVCPFELALDLTEWCDVIICDYNYLFDPVVSLKRFFSEEGGEYVFLIDEAHNLVDRSRDMYSAVLQKSEVLQLRRKAAEKDKGLAKALGKVNEEMLALRKRCDEQTKMLVTDELPEELVGALYHFTAACDDWLERHRADPLHDEVLALYFEARFFLRISELYDDHFTTYVEAPGGSEAVVKLLCLDPSALLDASMERGRSAILFSATLSPVDYFASVLGGVEKAKKYLLPSPFEPEHLKLLVADRVSTKYTDRERSLRPIAELIRAFTAARAGNYLVFFPSYRYLNDVHEGFLDLCPDAQTLVQTGGMDEAQREAFLAEFTADRPGTMVGFCVLGGIYSEGIDLKGERLIGTVIVGVGLPQLSAGQDILKDYYNRRNGAGFDFAYRYPGMNKVLQAAGRVIRGEEDRGAVLLVDSRFSTPPYRALFPPHWGHFRCISGAEQLRRELEDFWGGAVAAENGKKITKNL